MMLDTEGKSGERHDFPQSSRRDTAVERARALAANGENEAAKLAYLDALQLDPTYFPALNEIGTLAYASGHRSAARTAYVQAVMCDPANPVGRVNLGNLLFEAGELAEAQFHYQAAVAVDPDFAAAHQGLARVLTELGNPAADLHRQKGFTGHAIVAAAHHHVAARTPILMLVSERGGNMPTKQWIDERLFAVTAIYAEFYDPAPPLPPHALVVNAIGDADFCGLALARAREVLARTTAPVINPPALVQASGRVDNARRLGAIDGVIAPRITELPRHVLPAADLRFPLLLRTPGFHTGQHFLYVENRAALTAAAAALPGETLLAIQYLDARGADGMARKYRVMFIDGALYPLHLAIADDWKVHYFSAAMATNAAYRDEERRFLDEMPATLGERAVAALAGIGAALGLDYAGIDFACAPDGSILFFEANATMVILPPDPDPIWDYRRRPIGDVVAAAKRMVVRRAEIALGKPLGNRSPCAIASGACSPI